jgi:O-antigen ligase
LPLLLGLALAALLGYLIATENWYFAILVAVGLPAVYLFLRQPLLAIMLWVLLIPYFVVTPSSTLRLIYWLLHRTMIPAALIAVVAAPLLGIGTTKRIRFGRAELAMLAFLALTSISILLQSEDPARAAIQLYDKLFVPFCAYWLVRLAAPDEREITAFLWVALFTLVAQFTIGLLGWFAPELLPGRWAYRAQGLQRGVGTLQAAAVYTSALIFLGLLLYQYAMNCGSRRIRNLLLLIIGLAAFSVLMSFSRDSWLGGLAVCTGLLVIYPKPTLRLAAAIILVVSILGATILGPEIAWGYTRLASDKSQQSAESRLVTNYALLRMIAAKPLHGWGYNSYKLYSPEFTTDVFALSGEGREENPSHNTFLTIASELGISGLLLYFVPVVWWLAVSIRVRRRMPRTGFWSWRLVVVLWLVLLHIFIVSNFMDMVRFHSFGTTVWWMVLGLIAAITYPFLSPDDYVAPRWMLPNDLS